MAKLRRTGEGKYQFGLDSVERRYLVEALQESVNEYARDCARMANHFGVRSEVWKFFNQRLLKWEKLLRDLREG